MYTCRELFKDALSDGGCEVDVVFGEGVFIVVLVLFNVYCFTISQFLTLYKFAFKNLFTQVFTLMSFQMFMSSFSQLNTKNNFIFKCYMKLNWNHIRHQIQEKVIHILSHFIERQTDLSDTQCSHPLSATLRRPAMLQEHEHGCVKKQPTTTKQHCSSKCLADLLLF